MQNSPKLEDRIGRGKFLKTLGALALAGALALPGCAGVQTTANTNGNIPKMDGVWIMETTRGNNKIQISQDGDYYEGKLIDGLGGNFTPGYKYLYGNVSPDGTISCNLIFPDGLRYHKSDLVGNDQFYCRFGSKPFPLRRSLENGLDPGLSKCGLRVTSVDSASPAEKAGVKVGDVIIGARVNGKGLDYERIRKDPSMSLWQEAILPLVEYELITRTGNYRITKEEQKETGLRWTSSEPCRK